MITINGQSYEGNNLEIRGDQIIIDGKMVGSAGSAQRLDVHVTGNLTSLKCDGSATVSGNVTGNVSSGGSLQCGDVGGNANAGGSLRASRLSGNANAGGSVRIG